jgi:hypothetical protein
VIGEDFNIKFRGFHPSEFTESYLDERMRELQAEAPYGSALNASFTFQEKGIKAVVRITSGVGEIFATARGPRLREVIRQVVFQVRKQLGRRKTQRMGTESLRHLSPKTIEQLRKIGASVA